MSAGGSNFGTCSYVDCPNSHSANSNSTFFKFPSDDARRKKWIANCGNPAIAELSDRQLRGKRICALHFADSAFTDPSKKEILNDKAIPSKQTKSVEVLSEPPAKRRGRSLPSKNEQPEEEEASKPEPPAAKRAVTRAVAKVPEISEVPKIIKPAVVDKEVKHIQQRTRTAAKSPEKVPEVPKIIKPAAVDKEVKQPKRTVAKVPEKVSEVPKIIKPATVDKEVKHVEQRTSAVAKVPEKVSEVPKIIKSATVDKEVKHFQQRSKFGKALYAFIDELLSEEEPMVKREKKPAGKALQFSSQLENKSLLRTANGRLIKTEPMDTAYNRVIRSQKPILPAHMKRSSGVEQFITLGNESGNLIVQNGGQFTLAEGEEYEVIGESDGNNQIQVMESENNEEIEIIEVDDQTMAQLTAQNMFFPNSGSIQVSELDPNMGQILRMINPSSEPFYQSQ